MTQMVLTVTNWLNLDSLVDIWLNFKRKRQAAALRRQTIRELGNLTNAELNDIGLGRGDIYSIANNTYYADASPKMRSRISQEHVTTNNTNENLKGWV